MGIDRNLERTREIGPDGTYLPLREELAPVLSFRRPRDPAKEQERLREIDDERRLDAALKRARERKLRTGIASAIVFHMGPTRTRFRLKCA